MDVLLRIKPDRRQVLMPWPPQFDRRQVTVDARASLTPDRDLTLVTHSRHSVAVWARLVPAEGDKAPAD